MELLSEWFIEGAFAFILLFFSVRLAVLSALAEHERRKREGKYGD